MSHLAGLVEKAAASSQLEEPQVLVHAAARELSGKVVTDAGKHKQNIINTPFNFYGGTSNRNG